VATQAPKRKADFDLDELLPPERTIKLLGEIWRLEGEIPIPTVNRAFQLMGKMDQLDVEERGVSPELLGTIAELQDLVRDLFVGPVPDLDRVGLNGLSLILGVAISGEAMPLPLAIDQTLHPEGEDGSGKTEDPTNRQARRAAGKTGSARSRSPKRSRAA
jgi:hypothetical protein